MQRVSNLSSHFTYFFLYFLFHRLVLISLLYLYIYISVFAIPHCSYILLLSRFFIFLYFNLLDHLLDRHVRLTISTVLADFRWLFLDSTAKRIKFFYFTLPISFFSLKMEKKAIISIASILSINQMQNKDNKTCTRCHVPVIRNLSCIIFTELKVYFYARRATSNQLELL